MAPCSNNSDVYGYTTIFGAVRSDPKINSLYHPNGNIYFLSSPIGLDQYSVGIVPYVASNVDLGLITVDNEDASYSLCPLASLKSSADIKLEQ